MPYGFTPERLIYKVMQKNTYVAFVVLAIYVDDILLTNRNEVDIFATKAYIYMKFVTHNFHTPSYFLGIEFDSQSSKLEIS